MKLTVLLFVLLALSVNSIRRFKHLKNPDFQLPPSEMTSTSDISSALSSAESAASSAASSAESAASSA